MKKGVGIAIGVIVSLIVITAIVLLIIYHPWTKSVDNEDKGKDEDKEKPIEKNEFPPDINNRFAIQFKNDSDSDIKVYADNMPMCGKSKDQYGSCPREGGESARSVGWDQPFGVMNLLTPTSDGKWTIENINPKQRYQILKPDQVWQIIPPHDANDKPYWCFDNNDTMKTRICSGVGFYFVNPNTTMNAIKDVSRFEVNVNDNQLWYNSSSVDGANANFDVSYTPGCKNDGPKNGVRICNVPLGLKSKNNPNGCPVVGEVNGTLTCLAPKAWPEINTCKVDPSIVDEKCAQENNTQGTPTAEQMAQCPYPNDAKSLCKKAWCHKFWSENKCAQDYLNWLQKNPKGKCDSYGWSYDEKRYKPGDTFDHNFNPSDNTDVSPLVACEMKLGSLNVAITNIM